MKRVKYFAAAIAILCICLFASAKERRKPTPMEELTDPYSRRYVPYPYPKTGKEIIANLITDRKRREAFRKARIKAHKDFWTEVRDFVIELRLRAKELLSGRKRKKRVSTLEILEGKTSLKVGKIIKVKNRLAHVPHDYSWLILIMNKDNKIISRLLMEATGESRGGASITCGTAPGEGDSLRFVKTEQEIIQLLAATIGKRISMDEVKETGRMAFRSQNICSLFTPLWEIILDDGTIYYYSVQTDLFYTIEKRIPLEKNKDGIWEDPKKLVTHNDFVIDTISDEILVFKIL
jgi:hypothetical protein